MSRRPLRSDKFIDRPLIISALRRCREEIARETARMEINGTLYYSSQTVLAAIDGMALLLTGERDFLHLHGHGGEEQSRRERAMIESGNLFAPEATNRPDEEFATLFEGQGLRIERILSTGQASPPGFWYDQGWTEVVVLLSGSAGLLLEGEDAPRVLRPGDFVVLPPHRRHRVEWTDAAAPTVWLAAHAGI